VRQNPQAPVLIGGDTRVDYGRVYDVMVLLQQAGAPKVGLMSKPPDEKR
jgi:biopolymer transport protein TolR